MSDNDLDLENVLDDGDTDDGADNDSGNDQGPDQDPDVDPKDKRINDLMSKWQTAEARAKKLEAAQQAKDADGAKGTPAGDGGDDQQWKEFAVAQARDQVYASDPRFAEYGLDRSSIAGLTPAEMADAGKRMSTLFDQIETKMREGILRKHGLSPEVKSAPASGKQKSFLEMSSEEFEKELAKAKSSW